MKNPIFRLISRGPFGRAEPSAGSERRPGGRASEPRAEHLVRFLRERLRPEDHDTLRLTLGRGSPVDYDEVLRRAGRDALTAERRIQHNRSRIEERYSRISEAPSGRRETLLRNLPTQLLLTLTHDLIRESWDERFDNPAAALNAAEVAAEAAELLALDSQVDPVLSRELRAEALMYVGNSRRINGDLAGAEKAFMEAEELLRETTHESPLLADFASLLSTLRFVQGRSGDAAILLDREIRTRRRLGDSYRLSAALVNRGVVATWCEGLPESIRFLSEGTGITDDHTLHLLALHALGDRLARDGHGEQSWRVMLAAEAVLEHVDSEALRVRHRWTRSLAHRCLGRYEEAERDLATVHETYLDKEMSHAAALVAMDLVCTLAPQERWQEIQELAEEAYAVFRAEGLEQRALAAFRLFYEAARKETLSESLAVAVVNFLVRHQHNRELVFQEPE